MPKINENINEEWISDKTRYACDGLKYQRLDTPYIKKANSFNKISWTEALQILKDKINLINPDKIVGLTGDLTNMETLFACKELFQKVIKSKYLESREKNIYINLNSRKNYIFNSKIKGIEKSDLILLIGTNPRYEATMLNARIRKTYLKNNTEIFSLQDLGDLTYPYKVLPNTSEEVKKIIENNSEISNKIKDAKYPIIIFGESALTLNSSKYMFEGIKKFLKENNKINEEWNSLNILHSNASTVGSYDLDIVCKSNDALEKIKNNFFDLIFLVGKDNFSFVKKNEFIVYIGSHGDKGAEIADLVLPGAAFTEQDGYFTNLEGKLQMAFKASYPPGEAKEDWIIINEISKLIEKDGMFKDKDELLNSMNNYINLNKKNEFSDLFKEEFINEKIITSPIDYYHSNVIARSSKTMNECRNIRTKLKKTGTEG